MQAIARVNRVFRGKPGGLVVDYLGLAHELKRTLATYTESGGTGETALDQEQAVAAMLESTRSAAASSTGATGPHGSRARRRIGSACCLPLRNTSSRRSCLSAVRALSAAFALAVPHAEAMRIRDDVAFFQAVRTALSKRAAAEGRTD